MCAATTRTDFSIVEIANAAMLEFPDILQRNTDCLESINHAYDRLLRVAAVPQMSLLFRIVSTGDVSVSVAKQELCSALYCMFAADAAESGFFTAKCAIYILSLFTFLICRNSDGIVCVVDTHSVATNYGGNNSGVVVTASNSTTWCVDLASWLFCRVHAKNVVQHELAIMTLLNTLPQSPSREAIVSQSNCFERGVCDELSGSASRIPRDEVLREAQQSSDRRPYFDGDGVAHSARVEVGETAGDARKMINYNATHSNVSSASRKRPLHGDAQCRSSDSGVSISHKTGSSLQMHASPKDFSIDNWLDCEAQQLDSLPHAIDGWCKYSMKASSSANMMAVACDGRPWTRWNTSSRAGFSGVRRLARCGGSFYCPSKECVYLALNGKANKRNFATKNGAKVCFTCSEAAVELPCPAVKVLEMEEASGNVTVYHNGQHTCFPKRFCHSSTRKALRDAIRCHPGVAPSRIADTEMLSVMSGDDFKWEEVCKIASDFGNLKQVQNMKTEAKRHANPVGDNFEALGVFRDKCNELDRFLIFRVNNRSLNGEASFVFKSSQMMAEMAIEMDRNNTGSPFAEEYVHVDATHTRCRNFQTVTLWVYHPVMRKLMRLAMMDVEVENTENLTLFWQTFNCMLQKCSGNESYTFNPYGFVADEHHANWRSIQAVFGMDVLQRVVSCEFHYKQSVHRHARSLPCEESRDEFKLLADNMLFALGLAKFNEALEAMSKFSVKHDSLAAWLTWWYERRSHIFRAFKPVEAPSSNLAEVGHSKLSNGGTAYMSLLEAAKHDVTGAIRQQEECKLFKEGVNTGGVGADYGHRRSRQYKRAMKQAQEFGAEVVGDALAAQKFVQTSGIHRPVTAKAKKKRAGKSAPNANKASVIVESTAVARVIGAACPAPAVCPGPTVPETFHIALLSKHPAVVKCYGCDAAIRAPAHDVILQLYCNRVYKNKNRESCVAAKRSACYFHLNLECARKAVPRMELRDIVLHDETRPACSQEQINKLLRFGVV